jgi:hypothetical protein
MPVFRMFFPLLVLLPLMVSADEDWRGALEDGSHVTIDTTTNKATRTVEGETVPLWDGVHRLTNGAVIIVRDGVVVKDEAIIEAQQEQARDRLNAACLQLVKKVCGPHTECDSHPACDPARQLLAMERDELSSSWAGAVLESSTLCLEGLGKESFFQTCSVRKPGMVKSVCEQLVVKVCGDEQQCDNTEGCNAAHQLLSMEQQDLFNVPGAVSPTSGQCRDVLSREDAFFKACR